MSAPQAQQPHVHPRRRALKAPLPSLLTSSSPDGRVAPSSPPCRPSPRLRKGATFHSPSSPPSEDHDPILSIPSLPRRSPSCLSSLEAIVAGEQRMADILGRLDLDSLSPSNRKGNSFDEDELPVPRGILEAHVRRRDIMDAAYDASKNSPMHGLPSPPMDNDKNHKYHRRQASDSGLGTSISSCTASIPPNKSSQVKAGQMFTESWKHGVASSQKRLSAITSSISSLDTTSPQRRQLALAACKQIERSVLVPILKEEKLKPFHALVQSVPQRIVDKEITCLRDLEKTLLWLAPKYSASKASYLGFCEFSIQCIHTAVGHLNERDQRLPTDRPYTNGYFLDLVAQIRQYAAMMAASRERTRARRASGQFGDDVEVSRDERLTLEGGLSQNGRPAELVCHKDGKAISLRTGEPYDANAAPSIKRSLSTDSLDEGVERSMARRKKNAPPMDINQKCKDCDRVFKRPCDLTKHEKTHSRPWKCTEPTCKYFEIGWPTEKERDRHVNDKHSKCPALYKCKFAPCTYQSKRESNCKQHMEKAHGWVYIRSKNNGKSGKRSSVTQPTPQTPSIATPISNMTDLPTPVTGPTQSPYEPVNGYPSNPPFSFADPPANPNEDFQLFPDSSPFEDHSAGLNDFSSFPTSMDFAAFQAQLEAGDRNDLAPAMDLPRLSLDSTGTATDSMGAPGILDDSPMASTDNSLNFDIDWSNLDSNHMDDEFTAMNMQLLTPARSVEANAMNSFSRDPSISGPSPLMQHQTKIPTLSPGGQGNLMLYSPHSSNVDEGFSDLYDYGYNDKPVSDFTLYDNGSNASGNTIGASHNSNFSSLGNSSQMFPPLNTYNNIHYMNHTWAGQDLVDPSTVTGDMDMDDYLG